MDNYVRILTVISLLIFLVMIPLALLTGVPGFIPDIVFFMVLVLFYYWTYDAFRNNMPIFTLLVIGHLLHACGIFGWYNISPVPIQWDHLTHFFGTLPFALLFFRWAGQWMDAKFLTKKNLLLVIVVFFAAMGVGAMVELIEFLGYLSLGFGEGALMFGTGDGIAGLGGTDLIDALGGGWINEGWDFVFNTFGILSGMFLMIILKIINRKPQKAYYYVPIESYSKKI
ncbi:hypothetical protein KY309_02630 [Candidatus Woesearchaeota archaeon]|nr:hypothetical protein [Candidatus Woesearchaeota archaeon]MBW3016482.1 hypothetical protein [Candidatus Woesearchaeota archaeon]